MGHTSCRYSGAGSGSELAVACLDLELGVGLVGDQGAGVESVLECALPAAGELWLLWRGRPGLVVPLVILYEVGGGWLVVKGLSVRESPYYYRCPAEYVLKASAECWVGWGLQWLKAWAAGNAARLAVASRVLGAKQEVLFNG